jgi:hypothetical protein
VSSLSNREREVATQLVELLEPLRDPELTYHDDDVVGPDQRIREVVKAALEQLNVSGLGRCRLCLS